MARLNGETELTPVSSRGAHASADARTAHPATNAHTTADVGTDAAAGAAPTDPLGGYGARVAEG